jgi:outer membrane protein OmpA-like peptidoglycan-associated protein
VTTRARLGWPVAIAGLILIGLAQAVPNRHSIEDNLTQRSVTALEAAGLNGIQVSFVGRDGSLGVPRQSDVDKARSIVAALDGVRVVSAHTLIMQAVLITITGNQISSDRPIPNDLLLVAQALVGPGQATVEVRDGRITLSGRVPPPAREAAVSAAGQLFGESNVVDQLELLPPPSAMPPEAIQHELSELPPITFDNDKATLTADGQATVVRAAGLLRRNVAVRVRIEGHTDNDGSAAANLTLSQARAQSVLNALVTLGIRADRLTAVGYGEDRPKVPNTSPENRALNRRVEFVVELS